MEAQVYLTNFLAIDGLLWLWERRKTANHCLQICFYTNQPRKFPKLIERSLNSYPIFVYPVPLSMTAASWRAISTVEEMESWSFQMKRWRWEGGGLKVNGDPERRGSND